MTLTYCELQATIDGYPTGLIIVTDCMNKTVTNGRSPFGSRRTTETCSGRWRT